MTNVFDEIRAERQKTKKPNVFDKIKAERSAKSNVFEEIKNEEPIKENSAPPEISQTSDPQRANEQVILDQMAKESIPNLNEPGFWNRVMTGTGKAAAQQIQSGGFIGAPSATPKVAAKVATEVATIAAVEAAFIPLIGIAQASKYVPALLTAFTRLTQAGSTGAAVATTGKLVEEGELPSKEELVENGATWIAIDAAMQALHLGTKGVKKAYDFGKAVDTIAKEENIPKTEVLNRLWDSTKNFIKTKFGKSIKTPLDITPEDVQLLIEGTKSAEKKGLAQITYEEPKQIEFKPVEKKSEAKVTQEKTKETAKKVPKPKTEFKNYEISTTDKERIPVEGHVYTYETPNGKVDTFAIRKKDKQFAVDHVPSGLKVVQVATKKDAEEFLSWMVNNGIKDISKLNSDTKEGLQQALDSNKISHHIKNPPGKIEKVKVENKPPEKLPESKNPEPEFQKDLSPAMMKRQRDFIVDKIDKALENPPSTPQLVIKVPDDGVLKFNNNPSNLELAKARVQKNWPVKPLPGATGKSTKQSEISGGRPKKEETVKPLQAKGHKKVTKDTSPKRPIIGKEQAAKRSDILKIFRKAFNDPLRLGKFKQRALGIHKMWPKVSRLLHDNDIETAAHEIGHNLHTTLYGGDAKTPVEQRNNVIKSLNPYLDELKKLAHYEPYTLEGFAEFTRLYVTNPEVAQKLTPNFYKKFESDLDTQYPELKNALLEARDYYDKYLHGTPESRIDSMTDYAQDKSKIDSMLEWIKDAFNLDNLKTQFLDDVFPAKRLVSEAFGIPLSEVENLKDPRNLYRSLRVLKGAIGKADVFAMFETFDAKTLKKTGQGLRQILKQIKNDQEYREFNRYLMSRRTIEKTQQKILTGIEYGDAVYVQQKYHAKYEPIAQQLDEFNDKLLMYAVQSDLLSLQQYADIKKNNLMYTPFQRVMGKEKGSGVSEKVQAKNPIKRMKGSTRDIIAPIESIIKNMYAIIINSEKNQTAQVLSELSKMKDVGKYVEKVPVPTTLKAKLTRDEIEKSVIKHLKETGQTQFLEMEQDGDTMRLALIPGLRELIPDVIMKFGATTYPAGENIITVYEKGKPNYYEVSPEIYEMWNKGTGPYTADLLTKILRIPARTLRAGAILNPKFMQKNFIRDTWGGFLFTKYGKSVKTPVDLFIDTMYAPLSMLSTAAKQGPLYVEWLKAGGGMSTMQSLDRTNVFKKLEEVRNGYKPYQIIKWLRKVAEISEESNRLAEFSRALEVEGKTRLGMEIAAFAARDLSIDFAKMGLQVKMLNQIIPFFNATIQGGDKLIRSSMSDKDRAEFFARAVGFIALPSLIFAWLNRDDERVKEFQEQEKDFNFITFIGDYAMKIPVPFETGVIMHGLTQRMFNYMMTKDPDAFKGFMGSIMDAMMPNFIPSIANPYIEVIANKNFFTGGRIIPASKEDLISKYQYTNYSSLTARTLGRAISYMIGEDTRSKAASPAVIDHFINSWTGGLGRLIVKISDESLIAAGLGDKVVRPEQSIIEKLELDAFAARYPRANTSSIEKFYDNYQDAISRKKSYKYAEKMEIESGEELEKAYKRTDRIYDYATLDRGYRAIKECQKAINNIHNDPTIEPALKKQMIDDLYLQQIQFAKAANEDIKKHQKSFE